MSTFFENELLINSESIRVQSDRELDIVEFLFDVIPKLQSDIRSGHRLFRYNGSNGEITILTSGGRAHSGPSL